MTQRDFASRNGEASAAACLAFHKTPAILRSAISAVAASVLIIVPAALSAIYTSGRFKSRSINLGSGFGDCRIAMPAAISAMSFSRTSPEISFDR